MRIITLVGFLVVSLSTTLAIAEPSTSAPQEVTITVDRGYQLSASSVPAGTPLRLKFVRKEFTPCTKEVVFPSLGIRKELPPNKEVVIEIPPQQAGELEFHCGMKMVKGKLAVKPKA